MYTKYKPFHLPQLTLILLYFLAILIAGKDWTGTVKICTDVVWTYRKKTNLNVSLFISTIHLNLVHGYLGIMTLRMMIERKEKKNKIFSV